MISPEGNANTMCDSSATLHDTIQFIKTKRPRFLQAFNDGRYSLWIGSGISRERFPSLPDLMAELVRHLYNRGDRSAARCPYLDALREVLEIGDYMLDDLDIETGPDNWPLATIGQAIARRYSQALDVPIRLAGTEVSIVWDILELPKLYSKPDIPPDAEHYLLALLMHEGVISEIVTTNWDPLIEKAIAELSIDPACDFSAAAHPNDLHDLGDKYLLKIHGCAQRAISDRSVYGPCFIATYTQINRWGSPTNHQTTPLREKTNDILRRRLALFIGLSGQDSSLLDVAQAATIGRTHSYPPVPPKVLFGTQAITSSQRTLLRAVYNNSGVTQFVESDACMPQCAKPLLGSLYLTALAAKAQAIVDLGSTDPSFPVYLQNLARQFIDDTVNRISDQYDAISDDQERWRSFAVEVPAALTHFVQVFQEQSVPPDRTPYRSLCPLPLSALGTNEGVRMGMYHWLILACGALLKGHLDGRWRIRTVESLDKPYQLVLERPDGVVYLFIVRNPHTAKAVLFQSGFLDDCRGTILIYPTGTEPAPGIDPSHIHTLPVLPSDADEPLEIWLQDLTAESTSDESLIRALYHELIRAEAA